MDKRWFAKSERLVPTGEVLRPPQAQADRADPAGRKGVGLWRWMELKLLRGSPFVVGDLVKRKRSFDYVGGSGDGIVWNEEVKVEDVSRNAMGKGQSMLPKDDNGLHPGVNENTGRLEMLDLFFYGESVAPARFFVHTIRQDFQPSPHYWVRRQEELWRGRVGKYEKTEWSSGEWDLAGGGRFLRPSLARSMAR